METQLPIVDGLLGTLKVPTPTPSLHLIAVVAAPPEQAELFTALTDRMAKKEWGGMAELIVMPPASRDTLGTSDAAAREECMRLCAEKGVVVNC